MTTIKKADASAINALTPYVNAVLVRVLKLNTDEVFVSDFSDFSDFQGAGVIENPDWFLGIQQRCLSEFGLTPESEHETLLEFSIKLASFSASIQ